MMTTLFAALALAPVPTPEGQWGPSALAASALAKRLDLRLATLRHCTLAYRFNYDQPKAWTFEDNVGTIVAPGVFEVQVPIVDQRKAIEVQRQRWIADGKSFGASDGLLFPTPRPMAERPLGPAHPARDWYLHFSQIIFSGLGRPTHPFERLVAEASGLGLSTTAQSRSFVFKGQRVLSYRLVLAKSGTRYEIGVDGRGFLPIWITNTVGLRYSTGWTGVKWDPRRSVPLDGTKAKFRKAGATLAPGQVPRLH